MRFKLIGRKFIRRSWGSRAVAAGSAFRRCEAEARSEKHKQTRERERENINSSTIECRAFLNFFCKPANWNNRIINVTNEHRSKHVVFEKLKRSWRIIHWNIFKKIEGELLFRFFDLIFYKRGSGSVYYFHEISRFVLRRIIALDRRSLSSNL